MSGLDPTDHVRSRFPGAVVVFRRGRLRARTRDSGRDSDTLGARLPAGRPAVVAASCGVLVQLIHPFLDGEPLRIASLTSICCFALACVADLLDRHGRRVAALAAGTACGIGLLLEIVGLHTGFPFGSYHYTASLGPQVLGVPWIVPLAWLTISWPCLVLARRLAGTVLARGPGTSAGSLPHIVLFGALAMAAWDLVWDPQLVRAGHWIWIHPHPGLPGVDGVPLTNALGWLLGGCLLIAVLERVVPPQLPEGADALRTETVPAILLTWTWAGSMVANLVFFGQVPLAGYGAVALGVTVGPYWRSLLRAEASGRGAR